MKYLLRYGAYFGWPYWLSTSNYFEQSPVSKPCLELAIGRNYCTIYLSTPNDFKYTTIEYKNYPLNHDYNFTSYNYLL